MINEITKSIHENGLGMTFHFGLTHVIYRIFHQFNMPSIKYFLTYINNIYLEPRTSLMNEFINYEITLNEIEREFYAGSKQLESRSESLSLGYPSNFGLNQTGT